jgi:hypothetical protein
VPAVQVRLTWLELAALAVRFVGGFGGVVLTVAGGISTAAASQRSVVDAMSFSVADVPAAPPGAGWPYTQYVSPTLARSWSNKV